jgi:hypothetical protein
VISNGDVSLSAGQIDLKSNGAWESAGRRDADPELELPRIRMGGYAGALRSQKLGPFLQPLVRGRY